MTNDFENSLIVPIRLDALAVNNRFVGKPVRRWRMNYFQLLRQNNPEPPPFGGEIEEAYFDKPANWGVYLHWFVPEALRKGDQEGDEEADFPALPNRWLVTRMVQSKDGQKTPDPEFKCWLIKSDALDPDNDGGSTFAYLKQQDGRNKNPESRSEDAQKIEVTKLGKSYELNSLKDLQITADEKSDPDSEYGFPQSLKARCVKSPQSLNALGFGDVNFLAYQPFVNDVFSFHDDLSDLRERNTATDELAAQLETDCWLHYMVAGWYSHPEDDVLPPNVEGEVEQRRAAKIVKILRALNWTVPGMEITENASDGIATISNLERTIFYGRCYKINWKEARHKTDELNAADLEVAFGNNAIDALMALLGKPDGSSELSLLKPFIYGLLPLYREPGGNVRFNQEMRKSWFNAKSGGVFWTLEHQLQSDQVVPEVSDDAKELLEKINVRQENLEKRQLKLEELQKLLYDTWFQLNLRMENAPVKDANQEQFNHQIKYLKTCALAREIKKSQESLDESRYIIANLQYRLREELPEGWTVKATAKPPFFKPHDPTILIKGLELKDPTDRFEEFVCLLPKDLKPTKEVTLPPSLDGSVFAPLLKHFIDRPNQKSDKWEPPWNPTFLEWEQPWTPLFLEWEAEWFAVAFQQDGNKGTKRNTTDNRIWKFEVSDYEYNPDADPDRDKKKSRGQIIRGRTFLTAQNQQLMQNQLKNLRENLPLPAEGKNDSPAPGKEPDGLLKQFINYVSGIKDQQHLSQNLADFNNQLLMRSMQLSVMPRDKTIRELVGRQYQSQPVTSFALPQYFEGTRQGHFKINQLQVYDGFGQSLTLVDPRATKKGKTFAPLKDQNLKPSKGLQASNRLIELKPRILEYTRLRFDFVNTDYNKDEVDKNRVINIHKDVNPIFSWVLYNHLDKSLVLFNNQGAYTGEIRVLRGKVEKISLTGSERGEGNSILNQTELFELFLNIIDETLWTIDPNASLQEQHLAVWIGRPLALVNARLKFEAYGAEWENGKVKSSILKDLAKNIPLPDHQNPVFLKDLQQQFHNFTFYIKLGSRGIRQDGLIGYFDGGEFYTVHELHGFESGLDKIMTDKPAGSSSDNTGKSSHDSRVGYQLPPIRSIKSINKNPLKLKFSGEKVLTLLVDPGAAIYAQTGILPYASLRLPERFVDQALQNIQVNFRYHCLLTTLQKSAEPDARDRLSMPLPALRKGKWEWIEKRETVSKKQFLEAFKELHDEIWQKLSEKGCIRPYLQDANKAKIAVSEEELDPKLDKIFEEYSRDVVNKIAMDEIFGEDTKNTAKKNTIRKILFPRLDIQAISNAGRIPAQPALIKDGRLALVDPFREEEKD